MNFLFLLFCILYTSASLLSAQSGIQPAPPEGILNFVGKYELSSGDYDQLKKFDAKSIDVLLAFITNTDEEFYKNSAIYILLIQIKNHQDTFTPEEETRILKTLVKETSKLQPIDIALMLKYVLGIDSSILREFAKEMVNSPHENIQRAATNLLSQNFEARKDPAKMPGDAIRKAEDGAPITSDGTAAQKSDGGNLKLVSGDKFKQTWPWIAGSLGIIIIILILFKRMRQTWPR